MQLQFIMVWALDNLFIWGLNLQTNYHTHKFEEDKKLKLIEIDNFSPILYNKQLCMYFQKLKKKKSSLY